MKAWTKGMLGSHSLSGNRRGWEYWKGKRPVAELGKVLWAYLTWECRLPGTKKQLVGQVLGAGCLA